MKTTIILITAACVALNFAFGGQPPPNYVRPKAIVPRDTPNSRELKLIVLRYSEERQAIVVRFENRTHVPLKLLRPLDGSEWSWHMPYYDISMTDSEGKSVPLGSRCGISGLYSNMKWPDDYRIQILPGDAYEMPVQIARDDQIHGEFTVQFRYTYAPAVVAATKGSGIQYPDDLWAGSTSSEPVAITIPKPPQ